MNWHTLSSADQLEQIISDSHNHPILIFKHSTTCSISSMAENRLERSWKTEEVDNLTAYHFDLLRFRSLSGAIAETFGVRHQSPQVLIISDGQCIYDTSHLSISFSGVKNVIESLSAV